MSISTPYQIVGLCTCTIGRSKTVRLCVCVCVHKQVKKKNIWNASALWDIVADFKLISLSTPVCAEIHTEMMDPKQKCHLQKDLREIWNSFLLFFHFLFFSKRKAFFMHGFRLLHSEECCYQATGITMTQVLSLSLCLSLPLSLSLSLIQCSWVLHPLLNNVKWHLF